MAGRRIRGRSGVSRGPKNNVWSVVLAQNVALSDTIIEAVIVNPAEWQGSANSFQRATLLRIRGWLSYCSDAEDASAGAFFACIYVVDENENALSPLTAATYTDDDVLWTGGVQSGSLGTGAVETRIPYVWDVDVKAMRKLDSSREVRLSVVCTTGLDGRFSCGLRALVRKGGN